MKLSTILFTFVCTGTLLVQVLTNIGYKKEYEQHLLSLQQHGALHSFPAEKISAVVAKNVRFTLHVTPLRQGFQEDVRQAGIDFTMQGDTLLITSKTNSYDETNYFQAYLHTLPTLVLQNANVNILVEKPGDLTAYIEKGGQLLVQKGHFNRLKAEVRDSSRLFFDETASVGRLELTLKDRSRLSDNNTKIDHISPVYISDSASLSLSGRLLKMLHQH